jgi:two-component system KDP operon response regulator KdpE
MDARAPGRRTNVLVLTSEIAVARLVRSILEPRCKVLEAKSAVGAISLDIVIVDVEAVDPGMLAQIRRNYAKAQVIALCREYREADCVAVLGMDVDYLPRPFRAQELAARVRVAELRQFNTTGRRRHYRRGSLIFDLFHGRLAIEGRPILLSPSELTVLTLLASQAGTVATYDRLLAELGLVDSWNGRQALRSCVFGLRRKIERHSLYPEILLTEAGIGYQLAPSVDERALGETDQSPGDETQVRLRGID